MVLESGIFGLGLPEIVVVVIAIVLLIEPKNMAYFKPIFKAAYKAWLSYKKEVAVAEKEMEDVKTSVMEPINAAKNEAETEIRKIEDDVKKETGTLNSFKDDVKKETGTFNSLIGKRPGTEIRKIDEKAKAALPTNMLKSQFALKPGAETRTSEQKAMGTIPALKPKPVSENKPVAKANEIQGKAESFGKSDIDRKKPRIAQKEAGGDKK